MKTAITVLASAMLTACSTAHDSLVSKIPGDGREFEIVQIDYSPRQATAKITCSSPLGIFAFDLDPGGRKLKRLTLTVNNQQYCEGLTFQHRSGHSIEMLRYQGVQVWQEGADLVIEIVPPAVDLLKDGGRVQYVNQYR